MINMLIDFISNIQRKSIKRKIRAGIRLNPKAHKKLLTNRILDNNRILKLRRRTRIQILINKNNYKLENRVVIISY